MEIVRHVKFFSQKFENGMNKDWMDGTSFSAICWAISQRVQLAIKVCLQAAAYGGHIGYLPVWCFINPLLCHISFGMKRREYCKYHIMFEDRVADLFIRTNRRSVL